MGLHALQLSCGVGHRLTVTVAAAGDIACDPISSPFYNNGAGTGTDCAQARTSDLLLAGAERYAAILALGDLQYESGRLSKFQASYDPSWGRVKSLTRPAIGNSNCKKLNETINGSAINGCAANSSQMTWLTEDLAGFTDQCTLAYWHHPRFTSSDPSSHPMKLAWMKLDNAGADVILNGHSHNYQRYAPQTAFGTSDPVTGIREFVVGTGGKNHGLFGTDPMLPNEQVRNDDTFGILELELAPGSYSWMFKPEALAPLGPDGEAFTDSGTDACH